MNPQKIQTGIVVSLFIVISLMVMWFGLTKGFPLLIVAWGLFPVFIYFTNRPDVLLCCTIALFSSQLIVPGLPGGLTLFYIFAFVYVVIAFLGRVIERNLLSDLGFCEVLVVLFLLNLLIVMAVRGAGFRVLGDENWGGMRYVTLFITMGIFLLARFSPLTIKQWEGAFKWYVGFSLIPFIGELVFVGSGGAVYFHYYFLLFSELTLGTFFDSAQGSNLLRFTTAASASQAVVLIVVSFVRFKAGRKYISGVLLLLAFALASLSGHRLVLIRLGLFLWLFGLSYQRKHLLKYLFISGAATLSFVVILYIIAPFFPENAQRMVSFLPGIGISLDAQMSADVTTTWRLQVWLEGIKMVPEYFWLGRGYTFQQWITEELMLGARGDYVYFWAIETVAFHNGILSLLVGMGISGFFLGLGILIGLCYRNLKRQQKKWHNVTLKRMHNIFFINNTVGVIIFFTIYGDVHVSFPGIFFQFMLMEAIWFSNLYSIKNKNMHLTNNNVKPLDI